jgi:hypothetical protein
MKLFVVTTLTILKDLSTYKIHFQLTIFTIRQIVKFKETDRE